MILHLFKNVLNLFLLLPVMSVLQAQTQSADQWLQQPVDDHTFQTYLDFFDYDSTLSFAVEINKIEETEGLRRENLSFQSTRGMRVTCNLYYPLEHGLKEQPALILLHGGIADGKESTTVLAQTLARAGRTILALDFLHFGERKTGLLTTFTEKDKHEHLYNNRSQYLTWIIQNVKDIGRAVDFLVSRKGLDRQRIGLFGASRGAQVACIAAGVLHEKFCVVVMFHGGHFDALENGHRGAACPANYIARISPTPLLMVNGLYDSDYNKDTSILPLFRLANEPKKIMWIEGGHMYASQQDRAEIINWLNQHLR